MVTIYDPYNEKISTRLFRMLVLVAVLADLAFNYLSNYAGITPRTVNEVWRHHPVAFTPAFYGFHIWLLIYLMKLFYVVHQIMPSEYNRRVYDRVGWPLIATSMLAIVWRYTFTHNMLGVAAVCYIAMAVLGMMMLVRVKPYTLNPHNPHRWIFLPFAMYAGWLTVAVVANFLLWEYAEGYQTADQYLAIKLVIVLTLFGALVARLLREVVYPLTVAWGILAIYVANQDLHPDLATVALVCGILLGLWAGVIGIWKASDETKSS